MKKRKNKKFLFENGNNAYKKDATIDEIVKPKEPADPKIWDNIHLSPNPTIPSIDAIKAILPDLPDLRSLKIDTRFIDYADLLMPAKHGGSHSYYAHKFHRITKELLNAVKAVPDPHGE